MPPKTAPAAPDVAQFRTYEALLEAVKAHAQFLRDTSNGPKSVQYGCGTGLLAWARLYDVAGPRPIEPSYPPVTDENFREVADQMAAHRAARAAWEAKTAAALAYAHGDSE
jgi:flagellum-specific peptidoglycan hydrolase FlgJ